jgi:hypothetical protein
MPHLALPALTAYLRKNGVEVIQWDLNAKVFDQVLSGRYLRTELRQLRREEKRVALKGLSPASQQRNLEVIAWAKRAGPEIAGRIDEAKAILHDERFYDAPLSRDALITVADALLLASVLFYPSEFSLSRYHSAYPVDASQAIQVSVRDRHFNFYRGLFQTTVLPQIRRERPDLVGISLTSTDQVVAAFTLASMIKEANLPAHITVGGKMVTAWRDQLPKAAPLWQFIDSAVVAEGEVALLRLAEALDEDRDLSTVPNLMYREGSEIHVNGTKAPEPAACLPLPDFDGLPLNVYLAPARVLPVWASRGCYWGRCAFCNVGYGESKHFDELHAARVIEEMTTLADRYGTDKFFFVDEALSPRLLKAMSAQLIEQDLHFYWACCVRFEPSIRIGLLRRMRRAGCRMLRFGMESGSQRVLDRMDKGTRVATMRRVLHDSAEAGLWNHAFLFFGFPGETESDAQETISFFRANQDVIHSISSDTFLLEPHARAAKSPAEYGISHIVPPRPGHDLAYYYEYRVSSGVGATRAEEIEAAFVDSLPAKEVPQYYFHEVYQFLYACQFTEEEPLPTMAG